MPPTHCAARCEEHTPGHESLPLLTRRKRSLGPESVLVTSSARSVIACVTASSNTSTLRPSYSNSVSAGRGQSGRSRHPPVFCVNLRASSSLAFLLASFLDKRSNAAAVTVNMVYLPFLQCRTHPENYIHPFVADNPTSIDYCGRPRATVRLSCRATTALSPQPSPDPPGGESPRNMRSETPPETSLLATTAANETRVSFSTVSMAFRPFNMGVTRSTPRRHPSADSTPLPFLPPPGHSHSSYPRARPGRAKTPAPPCRTIYQLPQSPRAPRLR